MALNFFFKKIIQKFKKKPKQKYITISKRLISGEDECNEKKRYNRQTDR